MSKGALKSVHFRSRTGMHTLTGRGTAFCEILPKSAKVFDHQRRELKAILDTLEYQERKLSRDIRRTKDESEKRRLLDLHCVVSGRIGMLKRELPGIRSKTWSEIFAIVAQLWLNQESYYHIRDMTFHLLREVQSLPTNELIEAEDRDYQI